MSTHAYTPTHESVPYTRLAGAVIIQACADVTDGGMFRSREEFQTAAEALMFLTDTAGPWAEARDLWAIAARRNPEALLEYGLKTTAPYATAVREHVAALEALAPLRHAVGAAQRAVLNERGVWANYRRDTEGRRAPIRAEIEGSRNARTSAAPAALRALRAELKAIGAEWRVAMAEHLQRRAPLMEALAVAKAALVSAENAAWGIYLDKAESFPTVALPNLTTPD